MDKKIKTVVSGITPSGRSFHIGNYFGAVKPNIELQNQIENAYFFIADLHALSTIQDQKILEDNIYNVVLDYLALGLDPEKAVFFKQSDVHEHSELAIILGNYVSYGHLKRMHAFKDKLQKGFKIDNINMGLFNYPILMAADILLYKPDAVPVGEDQRQHVEITRDIAESFNKTYKKPVFSLPEPYISKVTGKIVGTDGQRKMSKSLGNTIDIFEPEEVIRKQIMGAYTDPARKRADDHGHLEGNTVFMYHDLINDNLEEVADLKQRYIEGKVGDIEVKEKLIVAHKRLFEPARQKRQQLMQDTNYIKNILNQGAQKATKLANQTLAEVKETIGLKK